MNDNNKAQPFVTARSGGGSYEVNIKLSSLEEMHKAHDLVLKAFKDAALSQSVKDYVDENQG